MAQYLVAIHHPDDDPSLEDEAMLRDVDVLNEEAEAAGVRIFAGCLSLVKMKTMKSFNYLRLGLIIHYFAVAIWPCLAQAQQACEKIKDLKLKDTSVLSAESVAAGPFVLPPGLPAPSIDVPAFCRVRGEINRLRIRTSTLKCGFRRNGTEGSNKWGTAGWLAPSIF
jgi:hypothetical protein